MSIVNNVAIYDLKQSLKASGYPMRTTTDENSKIEKLVERGYNLSKAADWEGAHDQFLTGIRVNFDVTFSNKAWVEAERYRFLEFVSSQSTMHRITKFDLDEQYNQWVDPRIVQIMKEKVSEYNALAKEKPKNTSSEAYIQDYYKTLKNKYLEILYSNPAGFKITARLTTNYRCLKNIWRQRRNHRLPEWREFCQWIETLPYAKELICFEKDEEGQNG